VLAHACDEMVCDLAQTYHILNYRALPVDLLATLVFGLRDDSRVKALASDSPVHMDTVLLAAAVDRLSLLVWAQTEDGQKGRNRPPALVDQLMGTTAENNREHLVFDSGEEFDRAWKAIAHGGEKNI